MFLKIFQKVRLPLVFLIFISVLNAENFRVAKNHSLKIPQNYEAQVCQCGIFDSVSVEFPEDSTFICGIEVNIKIPEIIASWRDCVAFIVYDNVSPFPSSKIIDYSGVKANVKTLPPKLNYTFYIPLNEKFNLKENPYATILKELNLTQKKFLFFRFLLAMKGAPESLEDAVLNVSVKPVLLEEGLLSVEYVQPEGKNENFSVYIDDNFIKNPYSPILLKTGEHHLYVSSESYRNEVRTFIIEQAKLLNLNIEFRDIAPSVTILSPENTKVLFDDVELNSPSSFTVSAGEHCVKFLIGDWEIQKNITTVQGRSYTVNLNVSATVTEHD